MKDKKEVDVILVKCSRCTYAFYRKKDEDYRAQQGMNYCYGQQCYVYSCDCWECNS